MFCRLLIVGGLLSLIPLLLGFTGRWLPLGESLAVFRLPNLLAACILLPLLWRSKYIYPILALVLLSLGSIAVHYIPQNISAESTYRLYQKNMSFRIKETDTLKTDILVSNADFITLQEVTKKNLALVSELNHRFPSQHTCPSARVVSVSVLSRWPDMIESKCFDDERMAAMKVKTPEGPVWLISIHLYWPYPYGQAEQVEKLVKHIAGLEGQKIIAGDFNMVPWSHTLEAFQHASDTHLAGAAVHSFDLPYIPMSTPIDHVLVPVGSQSKIQRRDKSGSDHYGILAEFSLP